MDARLAEIYGTNAEDQEKTAAAALAEGLSEDGEALDLDNLTAEQAEALAAEVLGGESDGQDEGGAEGGADEGQEKMAEADLMGRIMAHSMWQEIGQIKEANKVVDAVKGGAGKVRDFIKGRPGAYKDAGRMVREAVTGKGSIGDGSMKKMDRLRALGGAAKKVAPEGGAVLAAGGAYAAKKKFDKGGKKKKASGTPNFDALVEARMQEIAEELGVVEQEKTSSSPFDVLGQAVEQTAINRLVEAGLIEAQE